MKTENSVIADPPQTRSAPSENAAQIQPSDVHLNEILVPLDLSEMSFKALQYAVSFAAQYGARLTLLHVAEPVTVVTALGPAMATTSADIEIIRQRLMDIRENRIPESIAVDVAVRLDAPADGILNAATELEPDIIVLATHGRIGLERMFLGSTAEKVVRTASCPVLVVREVERDFV
jgi:nucleotide-binding universal stress UspA family protein